MRLRLIACNVFLREACHCLVRSPNVVDVEFLDIGLHVRSEELRKVLQERIDAETTAARHEAILLLYGVCGNSAVGLTARQVPLILPRAHDCATILLGSKGEFRKHFEHAPSTPFSSRGYMERGDYFLRTLPGDGSTPPGDEYAAYVKEYGEENARYIWDSLHPKPEGEAGSRAIFIDVPETRKPGLAEEFRAKAAAEGKEYVELPGSVRLIQNLVDGQWHPDEFLVVPPGQTVAGIYDWEEIVRAKPAEGQPG